MAGEWDFSLISLICHMDNAGVSQWGQSVLHAAISRMEFMEFIDAIHLFDLCKRVHP